MIKSMKTFWREYWELYKLSLKWCKKHWKGYITLVTTVFGLECVWLYRDEIKEKIKSKKETISERVH